MTDLTHPTPPSQRPYFVATLEGTPHVGFDNEADAVKDATERNRRAMEQGLVVRYEVRKRQGA